MGWTVTIGEGGTAYTIAATAKFNVTALQNVNDAGQVESVTWDIDVEGDLVAATPSSVADAFVSLLAETTSKFLPRRVRLTLDGTDKFDLQPQNGFIGPFVSAAQSEDAPGNGESRWRYKLKIFYRSKGNAGDSNAYDFTTSLETTTVNGKVVKKVWKAAAKAADSTTAKNKVLTFKPSEPNVVGQVEEHYQEARATGVWAWEAKQPEGWRIEEDISIKGFGQDVEVVKRAGGMPDYHKKRALPWTVTITGRLFHFGTFTPPAAHFTDDGDDYVRLAAQEDKPGSTISNFLKGEYVYKYQEIWLVKPGVFTPNHNGHDFIEYATAPADGAITGG